MNTILRKTVSLLSILGWFGMASWMAWGATYNIYFNNVEQGSNGTANPSLTVSGDGKVTKTSGELQQAVQQTEPIEEKPKVDLPVANTANVTTATQAAVISEPHESSRFPHWRVMGAAAGVYEETHSRASLGSTINLGYFVTRGLVLNAFGGAYEKAGFGGAETEVRLISVSLGRFDNVIDLGMMLGGSSLGAVSGNAASMHAGLRANLNFGDQWGFTAAIRGNLGYVMAEGGLAIHL